MKKCCLYFGILLSIVSCNKGPSEFSDLYVPDLLDNNIALNLADVFSSVSYIPLESNKGIYMNRINDLVVDDDFILAHDKRGNKLLQFDKSGKFIKEYMKVGRGPGEFFQIRSIDVNENKEILVLRDAKYLDIRTEQGDLLNSIEFETCPLSAKWLTNDIIILFYPYPFYLFIIHQKL